MFPTSWTSEKGRMAWWDLIREQETSLLSRGRTLRAGRLFLQCSQRETVLPVKV